MLTKKHLLSMSSLAALLVCTVACAQNPDKKPTQKDQIQRNSEDNQQALVDTTTTTNTTTTTPTATDTTQKPASNETVSPQDISKLSEAFGHFLGRNLKVPGINFDVEAIIKGIRDGYNGKPAPMSDKEYEQLMTQVQTQAFISASEKNLIDANEFLEKNAKENKVVELEPGKLQYTILEEGKGAAVQEHDAPKIKYNGKFLDGNSFGSSDDAGGSITVPLDQIIPGFRKGIVGMKEGEKRRLFIHPDLGYGTMGHLPPNSLLIFEIEVIQANDPSQSATKEDDLPKLSLDTESRPGDNDDEEDEDEEEEYEEENVERNHKNETPSMPTSRTSPSQS